MSRLFLLICSFVAAICCTCTTMAFVSFLRSIFADGCAWYSATAARASANVFANVVSCSSASAAAATRGISPPVFPLA